jgi:hypothetical protein
MGKSKLPARRKKQKTADELQGHGDVDKKQWIEDQEIQNHLKHRRNKGTRGLMKRTQKLKDKYETWDHKARHETYESLRNREWEATKKAIKTPTIERQRKALRASKAFEEYQQYVLATHPLPEEPDPSHMFLKH